MSSPCLVAKNYFKNGCKSRLFQSAGENGQCVYFNKQTRTKWHRHQVHPTQIAANQGAGKNNRNNPKIDAQKAVPGLSHPQLSLMYEKKTASWEATNCTNTTVAPQTIKRQHRHGVPISDSISDKVALIYSEHIETQSGCSLRWHFTIYSCSIVAPYTLCA